MWGISDVTATYAAAFTLGVQLDQGDLEARSEPGERSRRCPGSVREAGCCERPRPGCSSSRAARPRRSTSSAPVDYPRGRQPGLGPVAGLEGAGARGLGTADEAVALADEEVALLRGWGAPRRSGRPCGCSASCAARRARRTSARRWTCCRAPRPCWRRPAPRLALGRSPEVDDPRRWPCCRRRSTARACGARAVVRDAVAALASAATARGSGDAPPGDQPAAASVTWPRRPGRQRGRATLFPAPGRCVPSSSPPEALTAAGRAGQVRAQVILKSRCHPERPDREDSHGPRPRPRPPQEPRSCGAVRRRRPPARRPALRRGADALEPRRSTPGRRPWPIRRSRPRSPTWCARRPRRVSRSRRRAPATVRPRSPAGSSDAVLLRTSAMTELRVDAERRTARVGAGVLWGDVVDRAAGRPRRRCTRPAPGVGVVGSSLGGGLSWYARQHGLQCSALTAVELVLADGTFVRATDDHGQRPAVGGPRRRRRLRGGHRAGVRPAADADGVRRDAGLGLAARAPGATRVGRVGRGAPETVTSVARLFQAPDEPWLPGRRAGRRLVVDRRGRAGDPDGGDAGARAAAGARPEIDTFDEVPAASVARLQLDPEAPTAVYANSVLLDGPARPRGRGAGRAAGPGSGSELLFVELRQLGGALARPAPRAAPWTAWTARSWCSAWGSTRAPGGRRCARTPTG